MVKLSGVRGFVEKQSHNYRMILVRSAGSNFLMNLTRNYFSIYTTGLGADSVTLGGIRSVSSAVNMLMRIPTLKVMAKPSPRAGSPIITT